MSHPARTPRPGRCHPAHGCRTCSPARWMSHPNPRTPEPFRTWPPRSIPRGGKWQRHCRAPRTGPAGPAADHPPASCNVAVGSDGTLVAAPRGCSAAGSAPHWQCGGHGFEPRQLHRLIESFWPRVSAVQRDCSCFLLILIARWKTWVPVLAGAEWEYFAPRIADSSDCVDGGEVRFCSCPYLLRLWGYRTRACCLR